MPPYMGLCFAGVVPVLLVGLFYMLHRNGRSQQGLGNWALELRGGIWILFLILVLSCCGTAGKYTFLLTLATFTCSVYAQVCCLCISECSGCTEIRRVARNFTTKAAVKKTPMNPKTPLSKTKNWRAMKRTGKGWSHSSPLDHQYQLVHYVFLTKIQCVSFLTALSVSKLLLPFSHKHLFPVFLL